ncbi:LysR family transcriptional regulator [Arthrobacter sp. H14]|uniref:LysR family transcriptional regulator n=1 Tax=Arthrobacter sp. H14 TaxID=1312959 RepID=UPI0004B5053D|nr:LysR family transcriptional regulator [Arthrobacter sp. H14]
MHVELRHLRALVAVADEGTFTDAAISLRVSQAAISRSIAQFETVLGARLLNRTSRRLDFTELGNEVLLRARRALRDVDSLPLLAQATTLRVGYAWSGLGLRTRRLYILWEAKFPGVELILSHHNSPTGGIAEGVSDAAIVRGEPDRTGYRLRRVGSERRVCAVPRQHEWSRRRSVTLKEIASRPLALNRKTGTTTEALFPASEPLRIVETVDTDHWLETIAMGKAVGVTSEATAAHFPRRDVRYVPVKDAPGIPVWVMWPEDNLHPYVERLTALIEQVYLTDPEDYQPNSAEGGQHPAVSDPAAPRGSSGR